MISQETFGILQELLEFCHVFNNIYGEELVYEKTERNAQQIRNLFDSLSSELDAFIAYLAEQNNDGTHSPPTDRKLLPSAPT